MARNSLQMWNGYSSHQLIFPENPNPPNIMNDNQPPLEGSTITEVFANQLNAFQATHKIFIQNRRALRNKVRAFDQILKNCDSFFYIKREWKALAWKGSHSRWKGCLCNTQEYIL